MTSSKDSARFARLAMALDDQRGRVTALVRRMTGLGVREGMTPGRLRKLFDTLQQISFEKDKETEIISRIQSMEQRHRYHRKGRRLKRAAPNSSASKRQESLPLSPAPTPSHETPGDGWVWFLGALYFLAHGGGIPSVRHGPD